MVGHQLAKLDARVRFSLAAQVDFSFTICYDAVMKYLHKRAVWLFFVSYLVRWFVPVGIVVLWFYFSSFGFGRIGISAPFFEIFEWVFRLGWFGLVVFAAVLFVWARLSYHFYRYELTNLGFRRESGVIYKKYVTIPYEKIQNVDIYRGIIARFLGLSDLHIQTAGTSSIGRYGKYGAFSEGNLPGLQRDEAERLRDELVRRAQSKKPSV